VELLLPVITAMLEQVPEVEAVKGARLPGQARNESAPLVGV